MSKLRKRDKGQEDEIVATCSACGREYHTNALMVERVQAGQIESLCGYCDGSHDDYLYDKMRDDIDDKSFPAEPYPPEQATRERRVILWDTKR